MESLTLDRLDRQLVHALKVDGRATFSQIGDVLHTSDQTIARRYQRLRASDALRVIGMPGRAALGMEEWFVRIRCVPDAALPVAAALARRTDTYWIQIVSGGAEILCTIRPDDPTSHETLLLQKLPRTPRIVDVVAQQMLRSYEPDPLLFGRRLDGLDAAAVDRLRPHADDLERTPLDDTARAMLAVLGRDGRAAYPELAAASGCSPSTVGRRLDQLRRSGSLRFDIDIDHRILGQRSHALLWLSVLPNALTGAAEALATHPEVNFVAVVTGPTNIIASVTCANGTALFEYLTQRIGMLEGVQRCETTPVLRVVKRHGQPHLSGERD